MGGWVSAPPPPPWGGVGHLSVCGYAKILGGWVPELTPPPPPRVAKQNPGRLPWCVEASIAWAVTQSRSLPTSPKAASTLLHQWLSREAVWDGSAYASWHVPHTGACSEHCATWHHDLHLLHIVSFVTAK